jgi:integrase
MATLYRRRNKDGSHAKVWTADFWVDGRKFSRSTGCRTKREAEAKLPALEQELRAELKRQSLGIARLTVDTLMGTWWQEHAQHLASAQRQTKYLVKSLLTAMPGELPLDELSNKHIAAYVSARYRAGKKPATICRELDCLEGAYHMARDSWEHPVRPIDWKRHRPQKSERQIEKHFGVSPAMQIIAWLRENRAEHIARAVAWSIYTGIRLAGTRNLMWEHINLQERWARVKIKRKPGQMEDRWRQKLLSLHAMALLLEMGPKAEGPVFDLTNRVKHWTAARKAIGRPEVTWHGLRHTHASWLRKNAEGIEVVQRSLNHSNISTTMIYAHVEDVELVSALDKLPPLWDHGSNVVAFPPSHATSTRAASSEK